MSKLKKCPFCWGEAELIIEPLGFRMQSSLLYVECIECGASSKGVIEADIKKAKFDAIEAWNQRIK